MASDMNALSAGVRRQRTPFTAGTGEFAPYGSMGQFACVKWGVWGALLLYVGIFGDEAVIARTTTRFIVALYSHTEPCGRTETSLPAYEHLNSYVRLKTFTGTEPGFPCSKRRFIAYCRLNQLSVEHKPKHYYAMLCALVPMSEFFNVVSR